MAAEAPDIEAGLRALAHPGRRRALELVTARECGAGELAEACGWTRPATSQHLRVLRDAGLVDVRARGNRRLYRARPEALAALRTFLDGYWRDRLRLLGDQLGEGVP